MRRVSRETDQATRSFSGFRAAATAAVAALGIRELAQAANTFANINNQLRTIVQEEEDLAVVSGEVLRIANDTGTAYEAQASLVARIGRANQQIGASGQEILQVSEAISQTFALSGATAQETANATIQIGQALNSGRLQGDELRSVLENNAVLAQVIADEFGVGVGELRQLAADGEVTSRRVFGAILGQAEDINDRFGDFAPTLERAGQAAQNSFVNLVGQLDQALGISEALARAILETADATDDDLVPALIAGADEFRNFAAITIGQFALVANGLDQIFERIALNIAEARDESDLLDDIFRAVGDSAGAFEAQFEGLPDGIRELVQVAATPLTGIANGIASIAEETESAEQATRDLTQAQREEGQILAALRDLEENAEARREQRQREREEREERLRNLQLGNAAVVNAANELDDAQQDAADSAEELLQALQEENAELAAQAVFGDQANDVLQRRAALEVAAADGAEAFTEAIREQLGLLEQNRAAAEAAQAARDDTEFIATLERELELLQLTNEQREVQENLAQLSAGASDAQRQRVEDLTAAIQELDNESRALQDFFSETLAEQTAIGVRGALRSVFAGEFDDIRDDFSTFLSDLGQELLTSLFLQLLSNTFGNLAAGGGAGAGIFGALSQAFGGNRLFGGSVIGGQPNIVNERQGGEIFMPPPGGGRVFPDATAAAMRGGGGATPVNVSVINTTAAGADAIIAQETAAGREVARNNVSQDREFYQELFGV